MTKEQSETKGYFEYYDSQTKGLSLRVNKKRKTYYFENRSIGINRTKLGITTEISLARARMMSKEFLNVQNPEIQSYSSLTLAEYIEKVYRPSVDDSEKRLKKMTGVDTKLLSKSMLQIRSGDIESWIARRLKTKNRSGNPIKPSTVKREYNSLRAIFSYAFKADHIPFNKVGGIRFKGIDEGYREAITDYKELKRIHKCVIKHASPNLRLLWELMLHTGGRPKELCSGQVKLATTL